MKQIKNLPISALKAKNECGHRFVGGPGLQLVVGAAVLAAPAALEARRLRALNGRKLRSVDAGLHESFTLSSDLQSNENEFKFLNIVFVLFTYTNKGRLKKLQTLVYQQRSKLVV